MDVCGLDYNLSFLENSMLFKKRSFRTMMKNYDSVYMKSASVKKTKISNGNYITVSDAVNPHCLSEKEMIAEYNKKKNNELNRLMFGA